MQQRTRLLLGALIGAVVIVLTLVIFFSGFGNIQKQSVDYLALVFVLISEIALFGVMLALLASDTAPNKVFLGSGLMTTLTIYWLTTVILAIFLSPAFRDNISGFVTIQAILAAAAVIIVIGIFLTSAHIAEKNESTSLAGSIIQECESMIFSMLHDKDCVKITDQLNSIYEELKFSDKSTCVAENEREISLKIFELSDKVKAGPMDEDAIADAKSRMSDILMRIKERNMAVRQSKRGGY